jgi:protein-tyrosine phosphatase
MTKPAVRVLFVCLGNICRSPAAESFFNSLLARDGVGDGFQVDSAGTGGWHVGELPDARMRRHGEKRGLRFETRARQFSVRDFERFDHIVVMDDSNYLDVMSLASSEPDRQKISKMAAYHSSGSVAEVPDPYYGGGEGFEQVLDILEDACEHLLRKIK